MTAALRPADPAEDETPARTRPVAVLVWALVTVVLGLAVPFAPVTSDVTTVSWPAAGEPVGSTTLSLSPPRPASLDVTIPCAALRAGGDVLRTMPAGAVPAWQTRAVAPEDRDPGATPDRVAAGGLVVSAAAGRVDVVVSGERMLSTPLPVLESPSLRSPDPGDCELALRSGADGLRATLDGAPLPLACGTCADIAPPQVSELTTSAVAPGASPRVTIEPDDRYASRPGPVKTVLLIAHVLALVVLFVLLTRDHGPAVRRWWQGRRHAWSVLRRHLSGADAVVVVVSGAWVVLGPMNFDDSWYPLMSRDAGVSGYLGNAVYMFNVTENPFVASQYLMQLWGTLGGWSLVWMRVLPLAFGLLAYALLRVYLALALRNARIRASRVPWALLVGHLVWWLPFGLTLRPEPLIVLLSVVVLLLAELARLREAPLLYALGIAVAALSLTCSPTGLVAAAPLLVELPRWWPRIRASTAAERLVGLAVLAAALSVAVPIAFADASFADVVEASAVHAYYYNTVPWYDELTHYQTLLSPGRTSWGGRGPILLTLGVTVVVAAGSALRGPDDDDLRRLLLHSAATSAIAFALVAASPTKWVLHFPAVGAAGTVLLTVALLRAPLPRRERALATSVGLAVLVVVTSVTFAGWNVWTPYSDRGQPFGAHADPAPTPLSQNLLAPHLGPVFLRNPLVWIAVAVLAAAWAGWSARRWPERRLPRPEPDRAVLAVACLTLVVGMLGVFVFAPATQYPGWTVALGNTKDVVRGTPCGLQDEVTYLGPASVPLGRPTGPAVTEGDMVDGARVPIPRPVPGLGPVWHDATPTSSGRGGLVTGWYPVPADGDATDVVVPVLLSGSPDERVVVEFGRGAPDGVRVGGRREIEPLPNADGRTWQERPVSLVDQPVRPGFVRVVVEPGASLGEDRVAVAAPRLGVPRPIGEVLDGRSVLVDQMSAVLWPCVDQAAVARGIAPAPQVRIHADEDLGQSYWGLQDKPERGGAWRFDDANSTYVRLATAVQPGGPRTKPWGRVDLVVRDRPAGLVDVSSGTRSTPGWERGPTLAEEGYDDVQYQGAVG
ncbi:arabinosyltransferase domain-containing protein [Actinomycetospora termitidis]|uniref:Arabinosyltransferase domain-containing protein n=1 Tax=Actinomycetospora termitidis TaxID=3053470 RepID=A0ABT7M2P9_9PSEU|nr:arabinosyltransferase domain-containing protein [Actinomycetospora sp. Odt1-22]MDL5154706.1 arabinosyltransferase domain-containing protein [Actinomycetospora sp. Odt1-22]